MDHSYGAGGLATDEILAAVAGAVRFSSVPRDAERQLAQARAAIDERLAELAMEHVLLRLSEEPGDRAATLALVLLGVEHPSAAAALRVSPREEAARLALALEADGAVQWASALRSIRDEGGVEEKTKVIQRPRSREIFKRERAHVLRVALAAGAVLLLLLVGIKRELDLRAEWSALPMALAGDLASVTERVSKLEELIEGSGLWLGLPAVAAERLRLEGEMRRLVRFESLREEEARMAAISRAFDANEAREKALLALEAGSTPDARHWFAYALERGGPEWEGAAQARQDLALLSGILSPSRGHARSGGAVTR
jgi:hypothetical protein